MTPAHRSLLGMSLLATGWVMVAIAAWIFWASTQRWFAVAETMEATQRIRAGRIAEARTLAAAAARRLPSEAAPALLMADLNHADTADRLVGMLSDLADRRDRPAMLAAVGLSRVMLGQPAEVDLAETGDGRLLSALSWARTGKVSSRQSSAAGDPPHLAVQRAALTVMMRAAWMHGDAEVVRRTGGALLLLSPRHPEGDIIAVAVLAVTPAVGDDQFLTRMDRIPGEKRDPVIRAVADLVPARHEALARRFPKVLVPASGAKP